MGSGQGEGYAFLLKSQRRETMKVEVVKEHLQEVFSLRFIVGKYTCKEDLEINFLKAPYAMYSLGNLSEPAVVCLSKFEDSTIEKELLKLIRPWFKCYVTHRKYDFCQVSYLLWALVSLLVGEKIINAHLYNFHED